MQIKSFVILCAVVMSGLFFSCSKETTNQVIDQVSDYYVRCEVDTGNGTFFKFDVNAPIGDFRKDIKSLVVTAQSLDNKNLTLTIYTGKDTVSQVQTGNYPLDSLSSTVAWNLSSISNPLNNAGNKITIDKIEEKDGKKIFTGTFPNVTVGNAGTIRIKNGTFRVKAN